MRRLNRTLSGSKRLRVLTIHAVALLFAFAACAGATQQAKTTPPRVNPDAAALHDFQQRIDAYLQLHKQAAGKSTAPKESNDTAKIQAARETLAATIQSLRKDAKPGDIFTPAIRARFRKVTYPEFKGKEGADMKAVMSEDAAAGVPLKVNAKYPEKASVTTMPPNILANLPVLPEGLEYRVVGSALILRDVDANLIVDYMLNAIPTTVKDTHEG